MQLYRFSKTEAEVFHIFLKRHVNPILLDPGPALSEKTTLGDHATTAIQGPSEGPGQPL